MNSRKNKVLMTPSSKPILIMSELKKSLMAKKFISKLKKGFIGAILSKEQCILINDPSYDSVAPHIKKNSKLKKQLENSLEQKKKVKFSFQKSKL